MCLRETEKRNGGYEMMQFKCRGKWLSVSDILINGVLIAYALTPFEEAPECSQSHSHSDDDVVLPLINILITDTFANT